MFSVFSVVQSLDLRNLPVLGFGRGSGDNARPRFPGRFAMQRIESLQDIYPVFRELFKKKLA